MELCADLAYNAFSHVITPTLSTAMYLNAMQLYEDLSIWTSPGIVDPRNNIDGTYQQIALGSIFKQLLLI
jgi:hypothetical protein